MLLAALAVGGLVSDQGCVVCFSGRPDVALCIRALISCCPMLRGLCIHLVSPAVVVVVSLTRELRCQFRRCRTPRGRIPSTPFLSATLPAPPSRAPNHLSVANITGPPPPRAVLPYAKHRNSSRLGGSCSGKSIGYRAAGEAARITIALSHALLRRSHHDGVLSGCDN